MYGQGGIDRQQKEKRRQRPPFFRAKAS